MGRNSTSPPRDELGGNPIAGRCGRRAARCRAGRCSSSALGTPRCTSSSPSPWHVRAASLSPKPTRPTRHDARQPISAALTATLKRSTYRV